MPSPSSTRRLAVAGALASVAAGAFAFVMMEPSPPGVGMPPPVALPPVGKPPISSDTEPTEASEAEQKALLAAMERAERAARERAERSEREAAARFAKDEAERQALLRALAERPPRPTSTNESRPTKSRCAPDDFLCAIKAAAGKPPPPPAPSCEPGDPLCGLSDGPPVRHACECVKGDPLCSCLSNEGAVAEVPKTQPIARFPTVEAPDDVVSGREFTVQVSLTEEQETPEVVVKQGESDAEGRLVLNLPSSPEWPLEVVLNAPGFTIVGGVNTGKLLLKRVGDTKPIAFKLVAKDVAAPKSTNLFVSFWHDGAFLAKVARPIQVRPSDGVATASMRVVSPPSVDVAEAREVAPALAERTATPPSARRDAPQARLAAVAVPTSTGRTRTHDPLSGEARAPDLTLLVLSGTSLTVVSPHLTPSARSYEIAPRPGLDVLLRARFQRLAGLTPRGAKVTSTAPAETAETAVDLAKGLGRQLWSEFVPRELQDVFWRLRDLRGARFRTIQILSNDPLLPWELLRPHRTKADGTVEELDFLGLEYEIARWHVSEGGAQLGRPPQRLELGEVVAIAPSYAGGEALPAAAAEVKALARLATPRTVEGRLAPLRALFGGAPDGIVHFAGHGRLVDGQGQPGYALVLEQGQALDVDAWRGIGAVRGGGHPLFFLNACELGQAQQVAGFVDGWAPAVLDAGASGYIGGLWPLGDSGAAAFADRFYAALARDLAQGRAGVANALREARRGFYETKDPTFLAYVYYGDPLFELER